MFRRTIFWLICTILLFSCSFKTIGWKDLETKESEIQSFSFLKEQDSKRAIYYFLPSDRKTSNHPILIFFHGGAWTGGSASTFFAHAAYYAQHGFAAFSVDYRLLNTDATDITQCIQDVDLAVEKIVSKAKELNLDTTQIVLCGESAGGHLASSVYLNYAYPTQIKALILLNPVLDFHTSVFLPYMDRTLIGKQGRKMSLDSMTIRYGQRARSLSPIQYAARFNLPVLLINGDADKVTPVETAQQFFAQHPYKNKSSQLIVLPETGHAFSIPHYKSPESVVIETVHTIDGFLQKNNLFRGKSNIKLQQYTDWIPSKPIK